jgi:flagella basal body P-ring formation protein FlgA
MSRYIFGSILICVVAALIFFVWSAEREKRLDEINRKFLSQIDYGTGIAVYARDEIQKGTLITKELIEERRISVNKMPDHIATSASEVLGCKARFGVTKNYIVSLYDLDSYPPSLDVPAVICVKRIPRGSAIRDDAVEVTYRMDSSLPKNRFESVSLVLGRLARSDIEVEQVLIDNQVQPRWFEMQRIR